MLRGFVAITFALCAFACAESSVTRSGVLVNTLTEADREALRTRPDLVRGKYARMALGRFEFLRGTLPVFLRDLQAGAEALPPSSYFRSPPLVPALGDAHIENFGTMRAGDGTFALEPNDFDAADRWPFLWDLRRLLVAICIAARTSNEGDEVARALARNEEQSYLREAIAGYLETIHARAAGMAPTRVESATGQGTVLEDAFSRSVRDAASRRELGTLTRLDDSGARVLLRGAIDGELSNTLQDLPPFALASIQRLLSDYQRTLVLPYSESYFHVLDAAREFGSGISSWPRVRVVVLVAGPTDGNDDDVLLEIKETGDSGALGWIPPGPFADRNVARVRTASRAMWSRPDADPLLSAGEWFGMPVIIRTESDAFKTLRVSRLVGERGTPDALRSLSRTLGRLIARIHACDLLHDTEALQTIDKIATEAGEGFVVEETNIAVRYGDIVEMDFALFQEALASHGPLLGFHAEAGDRANADVTALFGTPQTAIPVTP